VAWKVVQVSLPPAGWLDAARLRRNISDEKAALSTRLESARHLAWVERSAAGRKIDVSCLKLGAIDMLHMPGELFVEYQLAAQKLRPDSPTVMAAYGDYGMGYIGLAESYLQGGYETGPASLVAPEVENVLMSAIRELVK
jgi:hypothetical protein